MHARRYFVKALDAGDKRAALPIAAYKRLYEIERELREQGLDPDAVLAQRRERSKPIWDELVSWCTVHKKHEPPSSRLGIALRYFTNHQVALARFLDYGYVPMDNGIVERLHVRTATWGSLCVTPSSARKPQRSLVRGNATRAAASPIACA